MKLSGKISYLLYCVFARHLPRSHVRPNIGQKRIRRYLVSQFIDEIGQNVNIEKNAVINPYKTKIGDNSGVGVNCILCSNITIGKNVLMGPNCVFFSNNHRHDRTDIPIIEQGYEKIQPIIIEDDVWIGYGVIVLPGVTIGSGSVIGAGSVVTKDIPMNSIACGNPAIVKKMR